MLGIIAAIAISLTVGFVIGMTICIRGGDGKLDDAEMEIVRLRSENARLQGDAQR